MDSGLTSAAHGSIVHDQRAWLVPLLSTCRGQLLARWSAELAAQPFHRGHPDGEIARPLPGVLDAVIGMLDVTAETKDPTTSTRRLSHAAQTYAHQRQMLGLSAANIITEQHLLHRAIRGCAPSAHRPGLSEASLRQADLAVDDVLEATTSLMIAAFERYAQAASAAQMAELERADEGLRLLVEASRVFAEASLEPELAMETISRYVGEVLGDGAIMFLAVQDDTRLELAGLYHRDAEVVAEARARLAAPAGPAAAGLMNRVFRSGDPIFARHLTVEQAQALAARSGLASIWQRYGLRALVIVPLRARGRVIGVLGMWREQDIADFSRREQQLLQELADRAGLAIEGARLFARTQEAVRVRDEVLGAVSHDLRGPLSAIKGIAQLLQRRAGRGEASAERVGEATRQIESAVTRMTSWIEELLDVAQLQAGRRLTLHLTSVDLVALVRHAVDDHQLAAPHHRLHVEASQMELTGWFDGPRVRRVLDNLLSNAVKYSPDGQPIVVRLYRQDAAQAIWAVIEVQDGGVGIPSADLSHVFEPFHRATNVVGRVAGTGIGLAGVKQILELHGGQIELTSAEGQGSTFVARLPLPLVPPTTTTAMPDSP
jgi:signal transduction histidine kinase